MDPNPRVSIITPVFNGQDYLEETLQSLVNLDYPNLELIVIDDGSTDNTYEIANNVLGKSGREFIIHSKTNSGEVDSDNLGLSLSSGKYVAFVNADDPVNPKLIRESVNVLESNPEIVVTYPFWRMIDQNGLVLKVVEPEEFSLEALIGDMLCLPGPGAVIRKSAFRGGFARDSRYKYTSDYRQWLTLSTVGEFKRIDFVLADWRVHSGQQTSTAGAKALAYEFASIMPEFFASPNLPPPIRMLEKQATATGYYRAAVHGSVTDDFPSWEFAMKSIGILFRRTKPPQRKRKAYRRNLLTLLNIALAGLARIRR